MAINENDAFQVFNALKAGQVPDDMKPRALSMLSAYRSESVKKMQNVFGNLQTLDAEDGSFITADRFSPGSGDKLRKKEANVIWLANRYNQPTSEIRGKYDLYKADASSQWGDAMLDDEAFFGRAREQVTAQKKKAQIIQSAQEAAFKSVVSLGDDVADFGEWQFANPDPESFSDEVRTAWDEEKKRTLDRLGADGLGLADRVVRTLRHQEGVATEPDAWLNQTVEMLTQLKATDPEKYDLVMAVAKTKGMKSEKLDKGITEGGLEQFARTSADIISGVPRFLVQASAEGSAQLAEAGLTTAENPELLAKRVRGRQEVIGDLKDLAEGVIDPIESKRKGWAKHAENAVYMAAGSAPTMAAAMLPGGQAALTGMFANESYEDFRRAGWSGADALAASVGAGRIQTAIERISEVASAIPGVSGWLAKYGAKPGMSFVKTWLARTAVRAGTEGVEEALQQATAPAAQELGSAIFSSIPDRPEGQKLKDVMAEFMKLDNSIPLMLSVLPLGALGASMTTANDMALVATVTRDPRLLRAVMSEAEARKIEQEADQSVRAEMIKKAWQAAPTETIISRIKDIVKQDKKAVEESKSVLAEAEKALMIPKIRRDAQGWTVEKDGKMVRVASREAAIQAAYSSLDNYERTMYESMATIADDLLGDKEAMEISARTQTLEDEVREGRLSPQAAAQRAELSARMSGMTPEQAKQATWVVLGKNNIEMVNNVRTAVSRIFGGGNVITAMHEHAHGRWTIARDDGYFTHEEGLAWVRLAESATGLGFLPSKADSDITPEMLEEAIVEVISADNIGRRKEDKRFTPGAISRGIASALLIRKNSRLGTRQKGKMSDEGLNRFKAFMSSYREFWGVVLRNAKALMKARKDGKLGQDYQDFLDKLMGVNADVMHDTQAAQEAVDIVEWPAFSITPTTAQDAESSFGVVTKAEAPNWPYTGETDYVPGKRDEVVTLHRSMTTENGRFWTSSLDFANSWEKDHPSHRQISKTVRLNNVLDLTGVGHDVSAFLARVQEYGISVDELIDYGTGKETIRQAADRYLDADDPDRIFEVVDRFGEHWNKIGFDAVKFYETYDGNAGRTYHLGFNPESADTWFSLAPTTAQDAEHMAAVQAGDTEKAQRMVDEAAKKAGKYKKLFTGQARGLTIIPKVKRNELPKAYAFLTNDRGAAAHYSGAQTRAGDRRDFANGRKGRTYRVFARMEKTLNLDDHPDWSWWTDAIAEDENWEAELDRILYLKDSEDIEKLAKNYGVELLDEEGNERKERYVRDDIANAIISAPKSKLRNKAKLNVVMKSLGFELDENTNVWKDYNDNEVSNLNEALEQAWENIKDQGWYLQDALEDSPLGKLLALAPDTAVEKFLTDGGYDSYSHTDKEVGGTTYIVFGPSQIKSANPVTYDESGNVIPLSQRFQTESVDIRFSLAPRSLAMVADDIIAAKMAKPEYKERFYTEARARLAKIRAKQGDVLPNEASKRDRQMAALRTLDAILAAFPPEIRGKVGGFVRMADMKTDKAREKELNHRLDILEKYVERDAKKYYGEKLDKLLDRARPKREAGKKAKGKLGADVHDLFDMVEQAMDWTPEKAEAHAAGLESLIDSGTLSPEQEAHDQIEAQAVRLVAGWKDASAAQRESAVQTLTTVYETAYIEAKKRIIAQREERDMDRKTLIKSTGKTGKATERDEQMIKDLGTGTLFKSRSGFMSFAQVLRVVFGDTDIAQNIANRERAASNQLEDSVQAKMDDVDALFKRMAGGSSFDGEKLRWNMAQKTLKVQGRTLSEMDGIAATMMWMQEDGRRHMIGNLDENGKPTGGWHYNQAFVDEIESKLSPQAKQLRSFLLDAYAQEWSSLNAVYAKLNGINLPNIPLYSPITVTPMQAKKGEMVDPVTGSVMAAGSSTPSALKNRSGKIAEPDFRDALKTYIAHTKQIEHWKAYAELVADTRALLANRDVLNSVEAAAGKATRDVLLGWVDFFTEGGTREAAAFLEFSRGVDAVTSRAASMALIGRLGTIFVQSTQLAAAAAKMPLGSYVVRLGKLMSGNLDYSAAFNSEYIQRRIKQQPPLVQEAMQGLLAKKPTRVKQAQRELGKLISGADGLFTAGTFAIVYDYQLKQARGIFQNEQEAAAYAMQTTESIVDEIAQPTRSGAKSLLENRLRGWGARLVWAFASESRKNLGLMLVESMNGMTNKRFARAAFYVIALNSGLAWIVRAAWNDAKDSEDDELFDERNWNLARLGITAATDWTKGVPILGDAIQSAAFKAAGEYQPEGNLLSSAGRGMSAGIKLAERLNEDGVIDGILSEETVNDADLILSAMGLANDNIAAAASLAHLVKDLKNLAKNLSE